jgi:chromosome segregation ATPase
LNLKGEFPFQVAMQHRLSDTHSYFFNLTLAAAIAMFDCLRASSVPSNQDIVKNIKAGLLGNLGSMTIALRDKALQSMLLEDDSFQEQVYAAYHSIPTTSANDVIEQNSEASSLPQAQDSTKKTVVTAKDSFITGVNTCTNSTRDKEQVKKNATKNQLEESREHARQDKSAAKKNSTIEEELNERVKSLNDQLAKEQEKTRQERSEKEEYQARIQQLESRLHTAVAQLSEQAEELEDDLDLIDNCRDKDNPEEWDACVDALMERNQKRKAEYMMD